MQIDIVKKLSRSDKVYLARDQKSQLVVLKRYKDVKSKSIETVILNQLSVSGYAPKIIEQGEDYIMYEYIEGASLQEKFINYTMSDDEAGQIRLANELSVFLQIFASLADGYIINDISFTNFIIKDGRCYGVDYDSVTTGMQYTDIAKVVVYASVNAVGGVTSAFPFITQMLKNFRLQMIDIINDVKQALLEYHEILNVDYILNALLLSEDYMQKRQSDIL